VVHFSANTKLIHAARNEKLEISNLMDSVVLHEAQRLAADEPGRLAAYTPVVDIIEKLKSIYYFAKRIAKKTTPDETD
jgi:phosphate:Na+ symporter|tara:strand:- start:859 stop:1092 length:234 start_codon:yes stop_codon:yes gene_type:complete